MGYWPAFWMLPSDGANMGCSGCGRHGVWAASGEIDIMELANDMKSLQVGVKLGVGVQRGARGWLNSH